MKKIAILLLCVLLLTGCKAQGSAQGSTTEPPTTPAAEPQATTQTPATEPQATEPQTTASPEQTVTLYVPNEDASGFDQKQVQVSSLSEGSILEALIQEGVLASDVQIISFRQEGDQLYLDMNGAFGTQLRSMGTAGEVAILGSLVNTFLTAYNASSVTVTENGQLLESGHAIYDAPLEMF